MILQAWVTLAINNDYARGALALASSLGRAGTTRKKVTQKRLEFQCLIQIPLQVVMVAGNIDKALFLALQQVFDVVQDVRLMDSLDSANLAVLERPELGVTFTKFNCWKLTEYSKCVFLDADTLVSDFSCSRNSAHNLRICISATSGNESL